MKTYKDLTVWKKAVDLAVSVYELTDNFPKHEQYGLVSQMRRAASSVPANIAEGKLRKTDKEFQYFLYIAFGSGGELETHIEIAKRLPATKNFDFGTAEALLDEVMRMLNVMIQRLMPRA